MITAPETTDDTPEEGKEASDLEELIDLEQPVEPGDADAQPT